MTKITLQCCQEARPPCGTHDPTRAVAYRMIPSQSRVADHARSVRTSPARLESATVPRRAPPGVRRRSVMPDATRWMASMIRQRASRRKEGCSRGHISLITKRRRILRPLFGLLPLVCRGASPGRIRVSRGVGEGRVKALWSRDFRGAFRLVAHGSPHPARAS